MFAHARVTTPESLEAAGNRPTLNSTRRPPESAAICSKYPGAYPNETQRSPDPCSCPHSKQAPALPNSSDPGVINSHPIGARYWKLPAATIAMCTHECCSSNTRSCGPDVHTASSTIQPSPCASLRVDTQPSAPRSEERRV